MDQMEISNNKYRQFVFGYATLSSEQSFEAGVPDREHGDDEYMLNLRS